MSTIDFMALKKQLFKKKATSKKNKYNEIYVYMVTETG